MIALVVVNRLPAPQRGVAYAVATVDHEGRFGPALDPSVYPSPRGFADLDHALAVADALNAPTGRNARDLAAQLAADESVTEVRADASCVRCRAAAAAEPTDPGAEYRRGYADGRERASRPCEYPCNCCG